MPHCRVVQGVPVRIPLSNGDWIDVKSELNAGEYSDFLNAAVARQLFAKILAYVLAWSFVGLDGKPLPWDLDGDEQLRRNTVRSLNKATLRELTKVLDKHEAAEEAALAEKKTILPTEPASSAISPSAAP
jgi:hypothetical protein